MAGSAATEFNDLRLRHEAATKDGTWGLYGLQVYRLAERHPSLPRAKSPVIDRASLPPEFLRVARQRQLLGRVDRAGTRNRWPEFALEVADEARKAKLPVPESFGPCRPQQLGPEAREVIARFNSAEHADSNASKGDGPNTPAPCCEPRPGTTNPCPA